MIIGSRASRLLATVALTTAMLAMAAPAVAEETLVRDGADASASLNDIRRVRADHRVDQVVVRIRFTNLRKNSEGGPASVAIFLDTRKMQRGPEFRLGTGLQEGTDFQLMRMREWKPVGEPMTCAHDVHLGFRTDMLRFNVARGCIAMPARVRVGAKMTDLFDGSHPVVDWLEGPRNWTRWLARD